MATAQAQTPTALQRLLEGELARVSAHAGLFVRHLPTGETAAIRADDTFNSARSQ
jgi:hypothetical protein